MRQVKYLQNISVINIMNVINQSPLAKAAKSLEPLDALGILLSLGSFLLWLISLDAVNIRQMNDLGLVSVFPPLTGMALATLMISFCLALRRSHAPDDHHKGWSLRVLLHLVLLIFMLYGVTALLEEAPRFSVVYRHAGYTEYIMRTG